MSLYFEEIFLKNKLFCYEVKKRNKIDFSESIDILLNNKALLRYVKLSLIHISY